MYTIRKDKRNGKEMGTAEDYVQYVQCQANPDRRSTTHAGEGMDGNGGGPPPAKFGRIPPNMLYFALRLSLLVAYQVFLGLFC